MNMEKIGDLRRENSRKTVKGFTLIEMLIVIAIIGILAAILSVVVSGFVRDSTFESCNTKAQLVYTAVQNSVIESEIKQDMSMFDAKYILDTGTAAPSDKLIYAELTLNLNNGELEPGMDIELTSYYNGLPTVGDSYRANLVWDFSTGKPKSSTNVSDQKRGEAMKFYHNYIINNLSAEFTGTCQVFIDLANYTVDTVVYNETPGNSISYLNKWYINDGTAKAKNLPGAYGTMNVYTQRSTYKREGDYFGCYPVLDSIGAYGTAYSMAQDNHDIDPDELT